MKVRYIGLMCSLVIIEFQRTAAIFLVIPQPYLNSKSIVSVAYAIAYTKTKSDMPSRGLPEIARKTTNDQGRHCLCLY